MKDYNVVFFDLDGTISDSGRGITNSVKYALRKFGIEETDYEKLRRFVGPPLYASFEKYYGFTNVEAVKAVEYYREHSPRGEYVLVLEGANDTASDTAFWTEMSIQQHVEHYINGGMSKMDATKAVAKDRGVGKSAIYNELNK
jgi:phosphoglycolate phosphatase-like HAD superfamily hydrolase